LSRLVRLHPVLRQKAAAGALNVAHVFRQRYADVPGLGKFKNIPARIPFQSGVREGIDRARLDLWQRTDQQHGHAIGVANQGISRDTAVLQTFTARLQLRPVDLMEATSADETDDGKLRVKIHRARGTRPGRPPERCGQSSRTARG